MVQQDLPQIQVKNFLLLFNGKYTKSLYKVGFLYTEEKKLYKNTCMTCSKDQNLKR